MSWRWTSRPAAQHCRRGRRPAPPRSGRATRTAPPAPDCGPRAPARSNSSRMVGSRVLVGSSMTTSGARACSTCSRATLRFMPDESAAMGRSRSMSKRRARASRSPFDGLAAQPAEELDKLAAGHVLVKAQLARQVGDVPPGGDAVAPAVVAGDRRLARGRPEETQQQAQGGGLSRSVGAEKAEHFARRRPPG